MPVFARSLLSVLFLTVMLAPLPALAAPILFSAAGANAGAITPTVDNFRSAVGGANNGNAAGTTGGRREINWDGGGAATTSSGTPFNGFLNNRGASFSTPGTGFVQATPAGLDTFFGRGDGLYDFAFDAFSAQRVFTPVGSLITDTTFFVPGTAGATAASVSAFGAIFADVDSNNVSSIQFFDLLGVSLGTFFVPPSGGAGGFSFLGVAFDAGERIGRVRITSGNVVLNATSAAIDQVVLDDFLFAEPQAVPEPAVALILLAGGAALVGRFRRKAASR